MTARTFRDTLLLASIGILSLTGCKKLFEKVDCDVMCDNYADCEDSDLDRSQCREDCFDTIDGNKTLEEKADNCANCISDFNDRSCSEVRKECNDCDEIYASFMGGASGK